MAGQAAVANVIGLAFERPLVLLSLVPCLAIVYALWRSSGTYLPPFRRTAALALRMAVISLLIVSLAGPLVQVSADQVAVAILLDRSDSISPAAQAAQEQWLASALAAKRPDDQVAVVTFAGDARVERPLSTDTTPPVLAGASDLHPSRTDLAAAIRMGVAALPPGMARRLVLLSDGQQNQEQAETAASLAAAAGVQLLTVPLAQQAGSEALVDGLDAPSQVRQGDRFSVVARVRATDPGPARLYLMVDGQLVVTQEVDLQPGSNRFVLPMEPLPAGHHVFSLQLEADADTMAQNNTGGAYVIVTGPPRVLVVEGTPGAGRYLTAALGAQGMQVDTANPHATTLDGESLRGYAAVILADVPAADLAREQMTALQEYVRTYGGGVVVSGGDQAFGPGGYARTPLEDMLPVQMGLHGQTQSASTALVLVIDNSGSMGEDVAGSNKLDLAKQAAMAAAQSLGEYDQIGVVAFEDQPRWVIQPTSARDLGPVEQAIGTMQPGGGTQIYPALDTAYQGLLAVQARVKHVVLLTDGEAPSAPYDQLTQQMRQAGITLSTIAVGSDADINLLQDLARMGNGSYFDGNDPFDLPKLVLKDTRQVQRSAIVEQDVQPQPIADSPALAGIDPGSLPALRGYVATTPRPTSSVVLASAQGDPLLSEWQYGLGRVMSWTSDVSDRWSSRWLEWPDFGRFWSQVVGRAGRPPDDPTRQISVSIDGGRARITLDAQTDANESQREYVNFQPALATLVDPRGVQQQIPLPQVAPGRYESTTPVEDDGVYRLDVRQTDPATGAVAQQSGGFVVPYSPEYRVAGTNQDGLQSLARLTGGRSIDDPAQAMSHDLPPVGAPRPVWPYLLTLMAVLLVLDVAVRRIRFGAMDVRRAYHAARSSRRTSPESSYDRPARLPRARTPAPVPVANRPATPAPTRPDQLSRSSRLVAARQRARLR